MIKEQAMKRLSKTTFTATETKQIFSLVEELEQVKKWGQTDISKQKQKRIRDKIRKIGLYWNEVAGRIPYTVTNLQSLFDNGILKTVGQTNPVEKTLSKKTIVKDDIKETVTIRKPQRKNSDEYYVIDLCDEILGRKALRQHCFDFLRGDSGKKLPVDAWYPDLRLVIEYHESQHTEATPFFDKKLTVSGVSRGEQRRIYDQRRQRLLPEHDIRLVIISYSDFGVSKKLVRNKEVDIRTVRDLLVEHSVIDG